MTPGAWIAVVAVVLALGVGLWRLGTDGRFRGTHVVRRPEEEAVPDPVEEAVAAPATTPPGADLVGSVGGALGERATLLQFSSAFCAPCRATRRVLGEVADLVDGVTHVEVDAEQHLDATRAFGILRTPTTVVLDATGREVTRATGAPNRAQVLSALGSI
ncbi:thioredoxin family protein [Microbacterium sp. ARD31]|uniref:TlpA family protein disulfide reductase n=1 Tax=Microbacterium sp. ARD31 TaxID=2962576 RepID=UPI0028816D3B|nr:thioredoxin family protein [Microbacterium sp. ARD31]MDT0183354.1 thioredoxin family protein [Microbacterium sp. ARD31]